LSSTTAAGFRLVRRLVIDEEHDELVDDDESGRLCWPLSLTGETDRACRKVDILLTVACLMTPAL
jgi:hypothetical protein